MDGGALYIMPRVHFVLKSSHLYENTDPNNVAPDIFGEYFSDGLNLVETKEGYKSYDLDFTGKDAKEILEKARQVDGGTAAAAGNE